MNTAEKEFHPLSQQFSGGSIVLADYGFRSKDGVPENCKLCAKGTWNDRMSVEISFSLMTVICGLKRIHHRLQAYIQARLASVAALFNILMILFHLLHPDADPFQMSIAEFSL
ncbi:hypothetical protein [Ktedonobacter sp. SOSP1-52]|uniref:hypothetical protein n=1 Tax=Ktedonobacter sp. SOSP1-52 TaxID=2778366 RepID=UPI0019156D56|nr:hypothetical protein [Ktedonobacter sp. SOSP1-52]